MRLPTEDAYKPLEPVSSGMATADRVLVQVTKHGTRLVKELPPWKRSPLATEPTDPLPEAVLTQEATVSASTPAKSRNLKKRSSVKRPKPASTVSVVTIPETFTSECILTRNGDDGDQLRRGEVLYPSVNGDQPLHVEPAFAMSQSVRVDQPLRLEQPPRPDHLTKGSVPTHSTAENLRMGPPHHVDPTTHQEQPVQVLEDPQRVALNPVDVLQPVISRQSTDHEAEMFQTGAVIPQSALYHSAQVPQATFPVSKAHQEGTMPHEAPHIATGQSAVPQSAEVLESSTSSALHQSAQQASPLQLTPATGNDGELGVADWRSIPSRSAFAMQNPFLNHTPPYLTSPAHSYTTPSTLYPSTQSLPLAALPTTNSSCYFGMQSIEHKIASSVPPRFPQSNDTNDPFTSGANSMTVPTNLTTSLPAQSTATSASFLHNGAIGKPIQAVLERNHISSSLPLSVSQATNPLMTSSTSPTVLSHQNPLINATSHATPPSYLIPTPPMGPAEVHAANVAHTDNDDTVSLSSLRALRPPKSKGQKSRRSKQFQQYAAPMGQSPFLSGPLVTSPLQYQQQPFSAPTWMSSPLGGPSLILSSNSTPAQESAREVTRYIETPRATPMAVLLSLEGFKASADGTKTHVNQDRSFIHEVAPNVTVFAVFDGHGDHGHHVAQFVSNAFQQQLIIDFPRPSTPAELLSFSKSFTEAQILSWLRKNFTEIDRRLVESSGIDCVYSGCTASIALRFESSIIVAYVGDSKVAGFQFDGKKPYCLVETPEHSPSSKNEYRRIKQLGANVTEQYYQYFSKSISRIVEAGLSVSRSFGDIAARPYGLISEPDFVQFKIPPKKHRPGKRSYFPLMLVVASDGLWDTISPYEILDFVSNVQQSKDKLFASLKEIAEVAWRRRLAAEGRSDDTTAIIALLQ